ncbi:MAG: hypothetical protein CMD70_05520 [Gammaproteobacteria bacterium]|jgi:hypothetical protein|nr:hypothetical protein [Gammaproteobacteria bacterium]|tara:strand:- start:153 stop:395 length:243 start_codon:yes stop_codon:yes gene_type:complete
MATIGRNQSCPCGSKKKYKKCCFLKRDNMSISMRIVVGVVATILTGGLIVFLTSVDEYDPGASSSATAGRVWSEEHQHWH